MKYLLLLLATLLTARASHGLGCLFLCNGVCDLSYKACSSVPASIPACLSTLTSCKSSCAKICSCVFQCAIDCTKPVCESNAPAAKKVLCTIKQTPCKTFTCPMKCVFDNLPKGTPSLPKLGDIKNAASILPANPADLFKPINGMPANPFLNSIPGLSANPFQNSNPGLPVIPVNNPLSLNTKPAAKTSLDIGNTFTNPAAKTPSLAAGPSPGSDDSKEQTQRNPFQPAPGPQKDVTKPANLFTNPASPNSNIPGPVASPNIPGPVASPNIPGPVASPNIPGPVASPNNQPKKKMFLFGGRK